MSQNDPTNHMARAKGVACGDTRWKHATFTGPLVTCKRCRDVMAREEARTSRESSTQRNEIPRQPGGGR